MRFLIAMLILSFNFSYANTGGLAGDPAPQPVRSVKVIRISFNETIPLNGFFTKFEEFHIQHIMERDLRTLLEAQIPNGLNIEQYIQAQARPNTREGRPTSAYAWGELVSFATSTQLLEGWNEVEGWHISINYPGWFNAVFNSDSPVPASSVTLTPNGLLLDATEMLAIEKELRGREDFWKTKMNRAKLLVWIKPMMKDRYSIMDIQTGGMFNWKDISGWQRLDAAQSRQFLTNLRSCELDLAEPRTALVRARWRQISR